MVLCISDVEDFIFKVNIGHPQVECLRNPQSASVLHPEQDGIEDMGTLAIRTDVVSLPKYFISLWVKIYGL